jgi:hypothetical protein
MKFSQNVITVNKKIAKNRKFSIKIYCVGLKDNDRRTEQMLAVIIE